MPGELTPASGVRRRLPLRLLRYRWGAALALFLLVAIATTSVLTVHATKQSAERAIEQSVTADQGGYQFGIQSGSRRANQALARLDGVYGVVDESGTVSSSNAEAPVAVRTLRDDDVRLGIVVAGRAPRADGEASVSRRVSDLLGIRAGGTVTVRGDSGAATQVEVVGITQDPADDADSAVVRVDSAALPARATVWLTSRDPYSFDALVPLLDDRSVGYRSMPSLIESQRTAQSKRLALLPAGLTVLWLCLLAVLLGSLAPLARQDASSMMRAGASPAAAWGVVRVSGVACVLGGQLTGFLLAWGGLTIWRAPAAGLLGQDWLEVAVPWLPFVAGVVATVGVSFAIPGVVRWVKAGADWLISLRSVGLRTLGVVGAVGALVWGVGWAASLPQPAQRPAVFAPYGLALMVVVVPVAIAWLAMRGLGPATRALARHLAGPICVVSAATALVAAVTGGFAARETHNANFNEARSGQLQPAGSYLVYEVPARAAAELVHEYERLGGEQVEQYAVPDERSFQVRVTGTALVGCLEETEESNPNRLPNSCFPQETFSPVNIVLLATGGSTECCPADPGLITDGSVGLLKFMSGQGRVTETAVTSAEPDQRMGGNMPGLVLAADSSVAQLLGMEASDYRLVALFDYDKLGEVAQAQLRGAVSRLAPGAQVSDPALAAPYARDRTVAGVAALSGAVLILLLMLAGIFTVVTGHRTTLRTVVDLGTAPRHRVAMLMRLAAIPAGSLAVTFLLTWATTNIAGIDAPAPSGFAWFSPFAAGLVGTLGAAVMLIRVPERTTE